MDKIALKRSSIKGEILACPFCMKSLSIDFNVCCKEAGHQANAVVTIHDEIHLEDEVEVIND